MEIAKIITSNYVKSNMAKTELNRKYRLYASEIANKPHKCMQITDPKGNTKSNEWFPRKYFLFLS